MSIANIIGDNIKKLRDKNHISQVELAEKMNMARPGISNWENGKAEPSSSQLVQLAHIFKVSTDELVGNTMSKRNIVVVDTSALIKRPMFIEELHSNFDEVIIPELVVSELNNLKDHAKPWLKQKAWLVMKSINENKDNYKIEKTSTSQNEINDKKIAAVALELAKKNIYDNVYLLSDDIYFQFLTENQVNLKAITPNEYSKEFVKTESESESDVLKNIEFYTLVKEKKLDDVKKMKLDEVNVNYCSADDGYTPLIVAVRNRDLQMIEYLLTLKDIDLNARDNQKYKFSALHHATQIKNMEIIKMLTDAGADIDYGSDGKNKGNTPLMISAWGGFVEGVKFFIEQGACLNQQDDNGFTPLIKGCINHHLEVVKLLIDKTDISIRSRKNKTAIEYLNPKNPTDIEISKIIMEKIKNDR